MNSHQIRLTEILNRPLALSGLRAQSLRVELASHGPHHPLMARPVAGGADVYDGTQDKFWYWGTPLQRHGNVAVIPITGILLSGPGGYGWPWVTFYEDIRCQLAAALDDQTITGIAFWIDSPGGVVSQCFELSEHIARARGKKPIAAIVYDSCCSAAYALASAADTVTVPATGVTGSVGVIMIHTDYSKALEAAGITTTIFRYGAHKAELQEVEPVRPDAAAREQATINALGERFVSLVAANRDLDPDAVRNQQAEVFLGAAGVTAGLADSVIPAHDSLDDFIANLS